MLTRQRNGRTLRKSSRSGAGNDCVYVTSPDQDDAEIEDSKSETALRFTRSARLALVRFVR